MTINAKIITGVIIFLVIIIITLVMIGIYVSQWIAIGLGAAVTILSVIAAIWYRKQLISDMSPDALISTRFDAPSKLTQISAKYNKLNVHPKKLPTYDDIRAELSMSNANDNLMQNLKKKKEISQFSVNGPRQVSQVNKPHQVSQINKPHQVSQVSEYDNEEFKLPTVGEEVSMYSESQLSNTQNTQNTQNTPNTQNTQNTPNTPNTQNTPIIVDTKTEDEFIDHVATICIGKILQSTGDSLISRELYNGIQNMADKEAILCNQSARYLNVLNGDNLDNILSSIVAEIESYVIKNNINRYGYTGPTEDLFNKDFNSIPDDEYVFSFDNTVYAANDIKKYKDLLNKSINIFKTMALPKIKTKEILDITGLLNNIIDHFIELLTLIFTSNNDDIIYYLIMNDIDGVFIYIVYQIDTDDNPRNFSYAGEQYSAFSGALTDYIIAAMGTSYTSKSYSSNTVRRLTNHKVEDPCVLYAYTDPVNVSKLIDVYNSMIPAIKNLMPPIKTHQITELLSEYPITNIEKSALRYAIMCYIVDNAYSMYNDCEFKLDDIRTQGTDEYTTEYTVFDDIMKNIFSTDTGAPVTIPQKNRMVIACSIIGQTLLYDTMYDSPINTNDVLQVCRAYFTDNDIPNDEQIIIFYISLEYAMCASADLYRKQRNRYDTQKTYNKKSTIDNTADRIDSAINVMINYKLPK